MASKAQHRARVEQIIACLNVHRTRATYGAVAQLLGLPALAINHQLLGQPRPEASWIVRQDGQPRGYSRHNIHPDLPGSPLVTTAHELLQLLHDCDGTGPGAMESTANTNLNPDNHP